MTSINQITVIPWLSATNFFLQLMVFLLTLLLASCLRSLSWLITFVTSPGETRWAIRIKGFLALKKGETWAIVWEVTMPHQNFQHEFLIRCRCCKVLLVGRASGLHLAKPNHQIRPIRSRFQYPHINSIFFLTYYLKVPTNHTLAGGCWTARKIRVPLNI